MRNCAIIHPLHLELETAYPNGALLTFLRVLLLEPLNPSFRIDNLLRSGEERMAIGTDIDTDVTNRRTGVE